jgi:UDP-N-acetylglucosamine 2-epimerase (non-hydrolysing)
MKTVLSVVGIRPDFIRMSEIFKKLDQNFRHFVIHTGQHYDEMMSDIFFKELEIREPDYNLGIGAPGKEHFRQTADVSIKIIELLQKEGIKPDIILFLGDSNSVTASVALKKEGYVLGHIEAGMRAFAKYMPEEINRIVCDRCSDYHFVYHENYKNNLLNEGFNGDNIFVVGNTIVEPCMAIYNATCKNDKKQKNYILMDIHRYNNIINATKLQNIFNYANECIKKYELPVRFLRFGRTLEHVEKFRIDIGDVETVDLMSYFEFIKAQYHAKFIISDSGTCPEEASILKTPVVVPRDENERWEAFYNDCAFLLDVNDNTNFALSFEWIDGSPLMDSSWLGDGNTSQHILDVLKNNILNISSEVWGGVVEYEGLYEVSNMGHVRSRNRLDSFGNYRRGKEMYLTKKRYAHTMLCKDGVRKTFNVHRLVANTFISNVGNKPFVNHKNGKGLDNRAENLEWVTASENTKHAYEIGLISHEGENHNLAKLSTEDVLEIRRLYEEEGLLLSQIAALYDICFQHVGAIVNRKKWKNLG